jgi:hypothetical protein
MVSKEQLAELRAANVKHYRVYGDGNFEIEFFPAPAPLFSPATLAPPPEEEGPPAEPPSVDRQYRVPPQLAELLTKPSVS